ncbi:hypothetical protein IW262DRAFT_242874 [Armillaria fumosa]|nr:hypothetical protein IW262DRAFT_242874 [Armillaria fumosa]
MEAKRLEQRGNPGPFCCGQRLVRNFIWYHSFSAVFCLLPDSSLVPGVILLHLGLADGVDRSPVYCERFCGGALTTTSFLLNHDSPDHLPVWTVLPRCSHPARKENPPLIAGPQIKAVNLFINYAVLGNLDKLRSDVPHFPSCLHRSRISHRMGSGMIYATAGRRCVMCYSRITSLQVYQPAWQRGLGGALAGLVRGQCTFGHVYGKATFCAPSLEDEDEDSEEVIPEDPRPWQQPSQGIT